MEQNDFSNSESAYCPDASHQVLVQSNVWFEEFQDGRHLSELNDFSNSESSCYPGPEVIKLFSCSTQLCRKFHLRIKTKILTIKEVSCFKSLRYCIYHANIC